MGEKDLWEKIGSNKLNKGEQMDGLSKDVKKTGSNKAELGEIWSYRVKLGHTGPNAAKWDQTGSEKATQGQTEQKGVISQNPFPLSLVYCSFPICLISYPLSFTLYPLSPIYYASSLSLVYYPLFFIPYPWSPNSYLISLINCKL